MARNIADRLVPEASTAAVRRARGLALRNWITARQYLSDHFMRNQARSSGASKPSGRLRRNRAPKTNGEIAERSSDLAFRWNCEQIIHGRIYRNIAELREQPLSADFCRTLQCAGSGSSKRTALRWSFRSSSFEAQKGFRRDLSIQATAA